MKVLIIGLGSMGKRRLRLIKQYNSNLHISGVDSNHTRAEEVKTQYSIDVYSSIEEAFKQVGFDCCFVCTSPLSHAAIISDLLSRNVHIFTELNLVKDKYDSIIEASYHDNIVFLSSTLLYRKDIEYIKNRVDGKVVDYIYHTGQYLPDWHTWENYKEFFVGDKRTNGCREIFAIDLPWITKTFGKITNYSVRKSKLSKLDIDYNDNYLLLLEHETGSSGILCVDVVSRKAMRRLEVLSEDVHLFWNGTPDSLVDFDIDSKTEKKINVYENISKDNNYCDNIIENAYLDEIKTFFNAIESKNRSEIKYSFEDDLEILDLIDNFESE